jgi:membrane-associated phospholipid phosphatase
MFKLKSLDINKILYFLPLLTYFAAPATNASALETFGDIGQLAMPIAALLATINHDDSRGSLQLGEAFALSMGTTFLLKPIINRKRPNGSHWSFPSGHTTSAFASASFLDRRYGLKYGVPAYLMAAAVGYSRVEAKHHYTSDVIAGAAIGIGANLLFTSRFKSVSVSPYAWKDEVGLQAQVRW